MAEGAAVAICSRHPASWKRQPLSWQAAARCGSVGSVRALPCDVTDPGQVESFIEAAAAALGGLDILVNNAGGARPGRFGTLTDDDWHADIEVKLFSQIRCTRAALPHLRRSSAPRVININAVYARYPDPVFLASSVNRASCLSLSKALSIELGREGILVNSVNIGFVVTPQWENIRRRRAPDMPAEEFFGQLAAARCRSAGSGGPTRWPAWSPSWPATGRATSPGRRSTSPAAWASTSRARRHVQAAGLLLRANAPWRA